MRRRDGYQPGEIRRNVRWPDESAQSWAIQPPAAAAPFDPAAGGVPFNVTADLLVVTAGDVPDPDLAIAFATTQFDPSAAVPFATEGGERFEVLAVEDITVQSWPAQPPAAAPFNPASGFPWAARDAAELVVQTGTDDTTQSLAVGPPVSAQAFNEPQDVQLAGTVDDTGQAWAVPPPLNAVSAQAFNQPEDEPFTTVEDPTVPALAIQPPAYVPVFQSTAWAVDGGEVQAVPGDDPSIQSWAVGPPQNAVTATVFNQPQDAESLAIADPTQQALAAQPPAFDPGAGFPWPAGDDIVQPVWAAPDPTEQAWAISPPPFIANDPSVTIAPWLIAIAEGPAPSFAATFGSVTVVTGGLPPGIRGYAPAPGGAAAHDRPGGRASSNVPRGTASNPRPQEE